MSENNPLQDAAAEAVREVPRKASPLSISIAVVLMVIGVIIYFNKDLIIDWHKVSTEVGVLESKYEVLQHDHEHCRERVDALIEKSELLSQKVSLLEKEITNLKERTASQ